MLKAARGCGGEPVLAETRIPVKIIIGWFKTGNEVDKLLKENTIEYQLKRTEGEGWR